jgi:ABC-2 type transport system ATP-binding protein
MVDEQGKTVFLSSHLLHEVQQVCDRVAIIDHGRIIAQGRVDEILRRRESIEVELGEDELDRAETLLCSQPWVKGVAREGNRLRLGADPQASRQVAEVLGSAGIFPCQLTRVSSTLEDFFLELTGKNNHG